MNYPPELLHPHIELTVPPPMGLLGRTAEQQAALEEECYQRNIDVLKAKVYKLAEFHGALSDGEIVWQTLALELAVAHVKGMQIVRERPRGRGRPKKPDRTTALYNDVLAVLDGGEPSVVNACRILSKRPGPWHGMKPQTLESRFHEVKRRMQRRRGTPLSSFLLSPLYPPEPLQNGKYPRPVMGGLFGLASAMAKKDQEGNEK